YGRPNGIATFFPRPSGPSLEWAADLRERLARHVNRLPFARSLHHVRGILRQARLPQCVPALAIGEYLFKQRIRRLLAQAIGEDKNRLEVRPEERLPSREAFHIFARDPRLEPPIRQRTVASRLPEHAPLDIDEHVAPRRIDDEIERLERRAGRLAAASCMLAALSAGACRHQRFLGLIDSNVRNAIASQVMLERLLVVKSPLRH